MPKAANATRLSAPDAARASRDATVGTSTATVSAMARATRAGAMRVVMRNRFGFERGVTFGLEIGRAIRAPAHLDGRGCVDVDVGIRWAVLLLPCRVTAGGPDRPVPDVFRNTSVSVPDGSRWGYPLGGDPGRRRVRISPSRADAGRPARPGRRRDRGGRSGARRAARAAPRRSRARDACGADCARRPAPPRAS